MTDVQYSTSDLWLAATLLSRDFELASIDRAIPTRSIFVFNRKRGEKIEDTAAAYYRDEILVAPRKISYGIHTLKSRILNGD